MGWLLPTAGSVATLPALGSKRILPSQQASGLQGEEKECRLVLGLENFTHVGFPYSMSPSAGTGFLIIVAPGHPTQPQLPYASLDGQAACKACAARGYTPLLVEGVQATYDLIASKFRGLAADNREVGIWYVGHSHNQGRAFSTAAQSWTGGTSATGEDLVAVEKLGKELAECSSGKKVLFILDCCYAATVARELTESFTKRCQQLTAITSTPLHTSRTSALNLALDTYKSFTSLLATSLLSCPEVISSAALLDTYFCKHAEFRFQTSLVHNPRYPWLPRVSIPNVLDNVSRSESHTTSENHIESSNTHTKNVKYSEFVCWQGTYPFVFDAPLRSFPLESERKALWRTRPNFRHACPRGGDPFQELRAVVRSNDKTKMEYCLKDLWQKRDPSILAESDSVGQNPLHWAAVFNNFHFLQGAYELLGNSVEWFNKRDNNQRTPLHLAVWNKHKTCVEFLLSIGVDRDAQDKGGYTPLYFAVYRNYGEIVEFLMHEGCDCTIPSYVQESNLTPLNQACIQGHTEVISRLLRLHPSTRTGGPNSQLDRCYPEIKSNSHAVSDIAGLEPVETTLAERIAAYVNEPDMNRNTPLISAIRNRHLAPVSLLLQKKADPIATDKHGDTVLHIAVNGSLHDFVTLLLEALKDNPEALKKVNKRGETVLDVALANEEMTIAKQLQKYGLVEGSDDIEEHQCLICSNLYFEPCRLECGHTLCLYCATASIKPEAGGLCPYRCKERTTKAPMKNLKIEKEIKEKYPEYVARREAAFFKQRANSSLQDFAKFVGMPQTVKFNENNTVHITFDGISMRITLLRRELYCYHVLHKGLPPMSKKATRLKMLTTILEGNLLGSSCCSGGITILNNNEIVLHMSVQLSIAKPSALREVVTVFSKCAKGWARHLEAILNDEDVSLQDSIVSESPAPSLMSERVGNFEKASLMVEHFRNNLHKSDQQNLQFDNNKTWHLKSARFQLNITYEHRSDCLYVFSPVWNGLPKRDDVKLVLYEKLLRLNLFFTDLPGAGVGIDSHGDFVLIHIVMQLGNVPHTLLHDCIKLFMSQIDRCIQSVHQTMSDPARKLTKSVASPKQDINGVWGFKDSLRMVRNRARLGISDSTSLVVETVDSVCECVREWLKECATQQLTAPHVTDQYSPVQMKLALCIGIDRYVRNDGTEEVLDGCANDAILAGLSFQKLGFHVLMLTNEVATTDTLLHIFNCIRVCAEGRKLSNFAMHFSGLGAYRRLERDPGKLGTMLLTHDMDEGIPVSVLRTFSDFLVENEVQTNHFILDCDFACRPRTAPCHDFKSGRQNLRTFPYGKFMISAEGRQPAQSDKQDSTQSSSEMDATMAQEWGPCLPFVWVMHACHLDERTHSYQNSPECPLGWFTHCVYSTALSTAHGKSVFANDAEKEEKGGGKGGDEPSGSGAAEGDSDGWQKSGRSWTRVGTGDESLLPRPADILAMRETNKSLMTLKPFPKEERKSTSDEFRVRIQNIAANKKSLHCIWEDIRVMVSYGMMGQGSEKACVGAFEQNPVLLAEPYTCGFKPFDVHKPLLNEIAEEVYKSYPSSYPDKGFVIPAGALHGVTVGQIFCIVNPNNHHAVLCKAFVISVQGAQCTLEPQVHGILKANEEYTAIGMWRTAPQSSLPRPARTNLTYKRHGSVHIVPRNHIFKRCINAYVCKTRSVAPKCPSRHPSLADHLHLLDGAVGVQPFHDEDDVHLTHTQIIISPCSKKLSLLEPSTEDPNILLDQVESCFNSGSPIPGLVRRLVNTRVTASPPHGLDDLYRDASCCWMGMRHMEQILINNMQAHRQVTEELGDDIDPDFVDPITGWIQLQPVTLNKGERYEEQPLQGWLTVFKTDPLRGNSLKYLHLERDFDTQDAISTYLQGKGIQGVPVRIPLPGEQECWSWDSDEEVAEPEKAPLKKDAPTPKAEGDKTEGPKKFSQRLISLENECGLNRDQRLKLRELFTIHCQKARRDQHPPPPPDLEIQVPSQCSEQYSRMPYLDIDKLVVVQRDPQAEKQWKSKWEQLMEMVLDAEKTGAHIRTPESEKKFFDELAGSFDNQETKMPSNAHSIMRHLFVERLCKDDFELKSLDISQYLKSPSMPHGPENGFPSGAFATPVGITGQDFFRNVLEKIGMKRLTENAFWRELRKRFLLTSRELMAFMEMPRVEEELKSTLTRVCTSVITSLDEDKESMAKPCLEVHHKGTSHEGKRQEMVDAGGPASDGGESIEATQEGKGSESRGGTSHATSIQEGISEATSSHATSSREDTSQPTLSREDTSPPTLSREDTSQPTSSRGGACHASSSQESPESAALAPSSTSSLEDDRSNEDAERRDTPNKRDKGKEKQDMEEDVETEGVEGKGKEGVVGKHVAEGGKGKGKEKTTQCGSEESTAEKEQREDYEGGVCLLCKYGASAHAVLSKMRHALVDTSTRKDIGQAKESFKDRPRLACLSGRSFKDFVWTYLESGMGTEKKSFQFHSARLEWLLSLQKRLLLFGSSQYIFNRPSDYMPDREPCVARLLVGKELLHTDLCTPSRTRYPLGKKETRRRNDRYILEHKFHEHEVVKLRDLLSRLASYSWKLNVTNGEGLHPFSCINVLIRHERQGGDVVVEECELSYSKPHAYLTKSAEPGDIIRMLPRLVPLSGAGGDEKSTPESLRCYMYLYDFLPSLDVVLLDRAPMDLVSPDKTVFQGTGGVVEMEPSFLRWKDVQTGKAVMLEHFKLFFCSLDCTPIPLMRHYTEETPREQGQKVNWCSYTLTFTLQNSDGSIAANRVSKSSADSSASCSDTGGLTSSSPSTSPSPTDQN